MFEQSMTEPCENFLQYFDFDAVEAAEGTQIAFPQQGMPLSPPPSARVSDATSDGQVMMFKTQSQTKDLQIPHEYDFPNGMVDYTPLTTPIVPETLQKSGEDQYPSGPLKPRWDAVHGDLVDWNLDASREWGMDGNCLVSGRSSSTHPRGDREDHGPSKRKTRTPSRKYSSNDISGAPRSKLMHRSPGVDFINFTPSDSTRILTGVTPSGSSKTKARREKEANEKRRRLSMAAVRAVRAAGGDVASLAQDGLFV